jgi:hypothetical protein
MGKCNSEEVHCTKQQKEEGPVGNTEYGDNNKINYTDKFKNGASHSKKKPVGMTK